MDQHAANIQLTMEAVTDVVTDLNQRVEDIEKAVTATAKTVEAQQQTVHAQTKDIHQRKAQQHVLDALDKEQRESIKHEVQIVVTDGYQGGAEGLGRLRDREREIYIRAPIQPQLWHWDLELQGITQEEQA